jgi:hypothetical protein
MPDTDCAFQLLSSPAPCLFQVMSFPAATVLDSTPIRRLPFLALLLGAVALGAAPQAPAHGTAPHARVDRATRQLIGIGDEQPQMFNNPLWRQLRMKIVRYIVPYDAAVRPYSLARARAWIGAAEGQHQQILIAFYHSEYTATRLPSVGVYRRDVERFTKLFPRIHQYQPWDEANRGSVKNRFASPSAGLAARYYQALRRVCTRCTVVGLDVLDQASPAPTLRYIAQFKRELRRLRTRMPAIWGLHDYSDVNRRQARRTREIVRACGGQVWLTETGGIVKFGSSFPNVRGSGLRRAARALQFMFRLASREPRIKRLYVYDWTGGTRRTRFDAGLTDERGRPRPGYYVVCERLLRNAHRCRDAVTGKTGSMGS